MVDNSIKKFISAVVRGKVIGSADTCIVLSFAAGALFGIFTLTYHPIPAVISFVIMPLIMVAFQRNIEFYEDA